MGKANGYIKALDAMRQESNTGGLADEDMSVGYQTGLIKAKELFEVMYDEELYVENQRTVPTIIQEEAKRGKK